MRNGISYGNLEPETLHSGIFTATRCKPTRI